MPYHSPKIDLESSVTHAPVSKWLTHWHILQAFFRIGMLGFGGGPSMIPIVKREVVDRYQWLTEHEFADVLAIGNTLPGPIATKMSGYIGYRLAGSLGAIHAVLALVIPNIVLMILFLGLLRHYKDQTWVAGIGKGVTPIVIVMMGQLTWEFIKTSQNQLGTWVAGLFFILSFAVILWLQWHPALLIGGILLLALIKPDYLLNLGKFFPSSKK